LVDIITFVIG